MQEEGTEKSKGKRLRSMPASPKEQEKRKKSLNQIQYKCRHPSHIKKMLYNHGWEKQQTL